MLSTTLGTTMPTLRVQNCWNCETSVSCSVHGSGGKTLCQDCRRARYCDRICQREHWRHHRTYCQSKAASKAFKKARSLGTLQLLLYAKQQRGFTCFTWTGFSENEQLVGGYFLALEDQEESCCVRKKEQPTLTCAHSNDTTETARSASAHQLSTVDEQRQRTTKVMTLLLEPAHEMSKLLAALQGPGTIPKDELIPGNR